MARPRKQTARRVLMIDAAGRAIAERGLANVRIKDIADQAGMSPGSVLYYYPELDDLLVEVHRGTVEAYLQHRLSAVSGHRQPEQQLRAALGSGLPEDANDRTARLLYEMHARCDRSPAHAALMTTLFEREVALYAAILDLGTALGVFTMRTPPGEAAHILVSLEDGLGLHVMSRNTAADPEQAQDALLACASALTGIRPATPDATADQPIA